MKNDPNEDQHHRVILKNASVLFLMIFIARLASAAKDVVIASRFGTSPIVDAYLFVFNLVGLPVSVWYSILTVCLIPILMGQNADGPAAKRTLLNELLSVTLVVGLVGGLALALILQWLFVTGASGLRDEGLAVATGIAPFLCILLPLGLLTHFGSVVLMGRGFNRNTLLEGVPAFVLMLFLLTLPATSANPLVIGSIVGAFAHLMLIWLSIGRSGDLPRPQWRMSSPAWPVLLSGLGAMVVGQILYALAGIADQFFAARIGPGSIATLGYANRIVALFLTLGATAIGRAVLPVFSGIAAEQAHRLRRLAIVWSAVMLIAGALIAAFGGLLSDLIVRLLFERGSFTPSDTRAVSDLLVWSLFQIPFHFAGMVVSSALFSQRRYAVVALSAACSLAVKILASFALVGPFGLVGLTVATGLFYAANFAILLVVLLWANGSRAEGARERDR